MSHHTVPPGTVLAAVGDTGALLNEVAQAMRRPYPTALQVALHTGTLRLFIPPHVLVEMERHLAARSDSDGDTADPLVFWRDHYLPWTFVVDVPVSWASGHQGASAVAARHNIDSPTARLSAVLGCPVFAEDRDLVDHGFGHPDWLSLTLYASNEAFADLTQRIASVPTAVLIEGMASLCRTVLRAPRWVQAAMLAAIAGAAYRTSNSPRARERLRAAVVAANSAVDALGPPLLQMGDWRRHGQRTWGERCVVPGGTNSLDEELAWLLASAPGPLLAGDLARALAGREPLSSITRAIRDALSTNPAFHQVSRGRWQLGRAGAPAPDDAFTSATIDWWLRTLMVAAQRASVTADGGRRVAIPHSVGPASPLKRLPRATWGLHQVPLEAGLPSALEASPLEGLKEARRQ